MLASDVLYEARNGDALLPLLPRLIDARGEIWLADPGRPAAEPVPRARPPTPSRSTPAAAPRSPRAPSTASVCKGSRCMSTQREKAEELRRLHAAPEPLVLVNAWDAASARVVAGGAGLPGDRDRELVDRGRARATRTARRSRATAMIDAVRDRRARGRAAGDGGPGARVRRRAASTVEGALEAGAVGCNLEDSDGAGGLWPAEEHAAVVAAARAAGDAAGIPLVINARTDVYLTDVIPAEERVVAALERGAAYLEAGADCIFVPGVRDLATLEALATRDGRPGQRARRRRRADAGRAGADRRRPRELRPGPAGRGDGRARRARRRRCSRAATRRRTWRSA